jgi:hypothetical protein
MVPSFSWKSVVLMALVYAGTSVAKVYNIPNMPYNGSSAAEFLSGLAEIDGQKVLPYPNESAYEW